MSYYFRDVKRFHDKFNLITPTEFTNLNPDLLNFRVKFLEEEYQEYVDSCKINDLVTAIDSLIDLVYITCGTAIYHGITAEEWNDIIVNEDALFDSCFFTTEEQLRLKPSFLSPLVNVDFTHHLQMLIAQYGVEASCQTLEQPRPEEIKRLLAALYVSTLAGASYMGIFTDCWDELWNDVQKCNMAKERVKRPEDSKRGSVYDVIKPKGWIPPTGETILEKYLS